MERYKQIISVRRLNRIFRYIIIGCGTTLISFGTFWFLGCRINLNPHAANVISVAGAITFAYIFNKTFVFTSRCENTLQLIWEIWRFFISRALTMLTEIGGLFLLHSLCKLDALASKVAVSAVVLLLNYIFLRFMVFRMAGGRE